MIKDSQYIYEMDLMDIYNIHIYISYILHAGFRLHFHTPTYYSLTIDIHIKKHINK